MAQWRIKEISILTKVSVRMLHHYDKIDLLKPSVRASNGYRLYSEQNLAKLQQIIALKFFGFSLEQIKTMLQKEPTIQEHLLAQQQILAEQTEHLRQTQDILAGVLQQCKASESLDWKDLIKLIERYHMTKELKKTWMGKVCNEEQQNRYIEFKQAYPKETAAWEKVVESMNNLQFGDPEGPDGEHVAKIFSEYLKALTTWQKSFKKASKKMTQEDASAMLEQIAKMKTEKVPLNREGSMWFAKAQIAHKLRCWKNIHENIKKNLDAEPESAAGKKLATQWRNLVSENCMGGTTEFFLGMKLLMEAARTKAEMTMTNPTVYTPEQTQQMSSDLKLLGDPMAVSWIEIALRKHSK